jgi:glutamate-1-semialdehyde 2,1-aminomutase
VLEATAEDLQAGLALAFDANGIDATINRAGSLLSVFFSEGPVRNFDEAKAADHDRFARFFHHMLGRGVYLPPSGYELWTLCTAFGDREREMVLGAASGFLG